ncbi:hypothetical protein K435DRAFT_841537 [Dendrothele bispora CBS 962.96]|uniref:Uncharacterized protein n=1 Tax=Dendrothele bispora (strain CBS 962.96) TaxID=1314807 RepID=A0A4S8LMK8_DENBC|nr:hypothetical protein K435DRAFT_841537 [Dendrothele bispora CBS 962.96]
MPLLPTNDWQNVNVKPCICACPVGITITTARTGLVHFQPVVFYSSPPDIAALLNPEVGDRFFVASTLLTRVVPNSKKVKRKGKGVQDKKKRKAQSKPGCPVDIQTGLDRYKSRFPRLTTLTLIRNTKREKDHTAQGFTGNDPPL